MPIAHKSGRISYNESTTRQKNSPSVITEGANLNKDVLQEELIKKPPKEFQDFAIKFVKKINNKFKLKNIGSMTPLNYVQSKLQYNYTFVIDDPEVSFLKLLGKSFLTGFTFGIYPFATNPNHVVDTEKTVTKFSQPMSNFLRQSGMKPHQSVSLNYIYYTMSSDEQFIFVAFPSIVAHGNTLGDCSFCLQCHPNTPNNYYRYTGIRTSGIKEANTVENTFVTEDNNGNMVNLQKHYYKGYSDVKKVLNEYFDITDPYTRRSLMVMTEAEHNSVLTSLTSKLYDHIIKKTMDINYGDIPDTKGDITKLPQYEDLLDCMKILKDILKEYKQSTGPIDTLSTALANIQTRKDLFDKAYRYDCELPIMMYQNVVLAIINGVSYMIAACIEFIKSSKESTYQMVLDKVAYEKCKDHLLYQSLEKFNKACEKGDFDNAMQVVIDKRLRKFTGAAVGILVGTAIGIVVILNIIPILRELVYVVYHTRMQISDFFEIQAELLQMNTYKLEHDDTMDPDERDKIVDSQNKIADKFRKISNMANIEAKKSEAEATKELSAGDKKYKLDDLSDEIHIDASDTETSSALF